MIERIASPAGVGSTEPTNEKRERHTKSRAEVIELLIIASPMLKARKLKRQSLSHLFVRAGRQKPVDVKGAVTRGFIRDQPGLRADRTKNFTFPRMLARNIFG